MISTGLVEDQDHGEKIPIVQAIRGRAHFGWGGRVHRVDQLAQRHRRNEFVPGILDGFTI